MSCVPEIGVVAALQYQLYTGLQGSASHQASDHKPAEFGPVPLFRDVGLASGIAPIPAPYRNFGIPRGQQVRHKFLGLLAGVAVVVLPFAAQATTIFGSLGNFDAVNNTGSVAHGTDTFGGAGRGFPTTVERYGAPSITEYSNGSVFGVRVRYGADLSSAPSGWNPLSGILANGGLAPAGENAQTIIRRYEFYAFTGLYDLESHEAQFGIGFGDSHPGPDDVGDFIGAQNAALNFAGPAGGGVGGVTEPASRAMMIMGFGSIGGLARARRRQLFVSFGT